MQQLFSDEDAGQPITYEQYQTLTQKGAKPPHDGYVLRTSSGESEEEEEDSHLVSTRHYLAAKAGNRAKKARVAQSKNKGKGKKRKRAAAPRKLAT